MYRCSKKRKPKGEVAVKINLAALSRVNTNKIPNYNRGSLRPGTDVVIPSHVTTTQFVPARNSVMDAAQLEREAPEVREAIIAKSKRIAIAYSKGAYQYVTDETDAKTIGKKTV